ncbi:MAG: hypothetical protein WHT06_04175 [Desulfobacterales bacterium]
MPGNEIFLITDRPEEHSLISGILGEMNITLHGADSIAALAAAGRERLPAALILDIDDLAVTNRVLREIAAAFPGLPVLGLSSRRFHPDLAESIRDCIYACLHRPLDPDEVRYWLKSILRDGPLTEEAPP